MQDQKIEKIAAFAVNITKMLVIIYLGFVEVFKIGKLLVENLETEFDISKMGFTKLLNSKKTASGRKSSECYRKLVSVIFTQQV